VPTEHRERRAVRPRAAPAAEQLDAVADVLDHLLDPLEDVVPSREATPAEEEAEPTEPWPPATPLVLDYENEGGGLRDFAARVRWSQRSRFRIPRVLAGWTLVGALFCGVLWLIFSSGAAR
jgi:hypothetical protein